MHSEAMIEHVWWCTCRPRWCKLGNYDSASLEIHVEARIIVASRCASGQWSSKFGSVSRVSCSQGGPSRRCSPGEDQSRGGGSGGMHDMIWGFIHWLTCNYENVGSWVQHGPSRDARWEMRNERWHMTDWQWAEDSRSWDDSVPGVYSTWWMLCSVYAVLSAYCICWMLYAASAVHCVCGMRCMLCWMNAELGVCWAQSMLCLGQIVRGVCCTRCMLFLVYAVLGGCCARHILWLVYVVLRVYCPKPWLYLVYVALSICCTRHMFWSVYDVPGIYCVRYMVCSVYVAFGLYSAWCVLCSLLAVLSVCCGWCMLCLVWTHDHRMLSLRGISYLCVFSWWLSSGWERERWDGMGEIIMTNGDLRELCVQVNVPLLMRQVLLLIQHVRTAIWGLLVSIRQVVSLSSLIYSYPPYLSHLHPLSLILPHNSPIIAEHNAKSSLSFSPLQAYEFTPSTVYTEYHIHQVQHTPSTTSTKDCLSSLDSHDYKLTAECIFSIWCASLQIDHLQPTLNNNYKVKSHSHGWKQTNWWIEAQDLAHLSWTASQSTTCKYFWNLNLSGPPQASPHSLDYGLQVRMIIRSICKINLSQSWPPMSHDHGLQVHLQTR